MRIDRLHATDALPEMPLDGKDVLVLSPTPTYPLDAGNRKRIYHCCRELQERGARIHFVYYPLEWPFTCIPQDAVKEMTSQWDRFHLLPVARPLQAPPEDGRSYHLIDEWWDRESIEPTLKWLFQRGTYDAFVVNYPYLSKAFELAPPRTLRILDMHDQFTGRRELLEGMGIAPEFFYTTGDQEAIALDRADLVWAIKDQEADFFRTLTDTPVVALPHVEPPLNVERRRDPADDGYLVLGIVGARNSFNSRNAAVFVRDVLPLLSRFAAPLKIRFGGGMCADLESWGQLPAGVELAGRFSQPEDYYTMVDAVLVPMAAGTGLKTKAVEAFALGMPVISYKHAVEGIPVTHPFHNCTSSRELADCCIELAFNPDRLEELRSASKQTYRRLADVAASAFDVTVRSIIEKPVIVMAIASGFVDANSAYRAMALDTFRSVRNVGRPVFYFDRPLPGGFADWAEQFKWLATEVKAVLSPAAALAMGVAIGSTDGHSFPLFYSVATLGECLSKQREAALWLLDLPKELEHGSLEVHGVRQTFVHLDALRLADDWSEATIEATAARHPQFTLATYSPIHDDPLRSRLPDSEWLQMPRSDDTRQPARAEAMNWDLCPLRASDLEVSEVTDGFVASRRDSSRIHYLNRTAAFILEICDGRVRAGDMPGLVAMAFDLDHPPAGDVECCLTELIKEGLVACNTDPISGGLIMQSGSGSALSATESRTQPSENAGRVTPQGGPNPA